MATKIRCEWYDLWAEKIGYKTYRRKTRCKAPATTTFSDNPRLYQPPLFEHHWCEDHAVPARTNAGMVERVAACV